MVVVDITEGAGCPLYWKWISTVIWGLSYVAEQWFSSCSDIKEAITVPPSYSQQSPYHCKLQSRPFFETGANKLGLSCVHSLNFWVWPKYSACISCVSLRLVLCLFYNKNWYGNVGSIGTAVTDNHSNLFTYCDYQLHLLAIMLYYPEIPHQKNTASCPLGGADYPRKTWRIY